MVRRVAKNIGPQLVSGDLAAGGGFDGPAVLCGDRLAHIKPVPHVLLTRVYSPGQGALAAGCFDGDL